MTQWEGGGGGGDVMFVGEVGKIKWCEKSNF